ncbi:hypothetical protein [Prosthecomicrobium sp. N25]|uniref:hypothetical protein n=1 Tax=Prosthecomicrobium sp. N25 TaxID=3129254 RepID=UPI003077825E
MALDEFVARLRSLGVREVTIEHHDVESGSPQSIACKFHFMTGTFNDSGEWEMQIIEPEGWAGSGDPD